MKLRNSVAYHLTFRNRTLHRYLYRHLRTLQSRNKEPFFINLCTRKLYIPYLKIYTRMRKFILVYLLDPGHKGCYSYQKFFFFGKNFERSFLKENNSIDTAVFYSSKILLQFSIFTYTPLFGVPLYNSGE